MTEEELPQITEEEEEQDEGGAHPLTRKDIRACIKKHKMYYTLELNEVLYLNNGSFTKIKNLEPFVNLKALWLNNNAITAIEGLSTLTNLTCLYLQSNLIEEISGLEALENLNTLCLSNNYISKVQGLENCHALSTLEIDHNKFKDPSGLEKLSEIPSLQILNLSENAIESDSFAPHIAKLVNLRVLRMGGNPIARTMKDYRRLLIMQNKELRYLDDAPVTEEDRRLVEAWRQGGKEGEQAEREKIRAEKEEKHKHNMEEFERITGKSTDDTFVTQHTDEADVD